jgi:uncharacterized protein
VQKINKSLPDTVHSVYVYGSVARGTARHGDSDIDLLLVIARPADDGMRTSISRLEQEFSARYAERFRAVELAYVHLDRLLDPAEFYGHPCFLKHLCVCIRGEDLRQRYPRFRPDTGVSRGFNGDLESTLERIRKELENPNTYRLSARSGSKKLLRTAFALVMPRERMWTDDLDTMAGVFEKYYPGKREEIRTALEWAKSPSEKEAMLDLLDTFGAWLVAEFDRVIPPTPIPDYPDAYLWGHTEFMGLDFGIDPRALVPRLETEVLVKKAGELLREHAPDLAIDTGTGSGVIPVALAKYYGYTGELVATDIDPDTLSLARDNADLHGVRMTSIVCDLLDSPRLHAAIARADSIMFTANLPYVPERDADLVSPDTAYEPRHALYSGDDGYAHIERYLAQFREIVRRCPDKSFALVMEMDPSHTTRVETALSGLGETAVFADYAGDRRFVSFTRQWKK